MDAAVRGALSLLDAARDSAQDSAG
jgi:hypothetical protein